jgi:hypothetical protein
MILALLLILKSGVSGFRQSELAPTTVRNQAVCFSIRKPLWVKNRVDRRKRKWYVPITKRITKPATFLVLTKKAIRKKVIACPTTIGGDARTMKIGVLMKRRAKSYAQTLIYSREKVINKSCFRVSGTNSFSTCSF